MNIDVMDSLDELGYLGPLGNEEKMKAAVDIGPKSIEFTDLTAWLCHELQTLCELESSVNAITDPDESSLFLVELSSFLKELHCPYESLMEGPISQRIDTQEKRTLMLNFLCTELKAAKIIEARAQKSKRALDIEIDASSTAKCLNSIMNSLDVKNVDIFPSEGELLAEIISKAKQDFADKSTIPEPILSSELTSQQWAALDKLQKDLHTEYKTRREMLLTRLDVTMQSFKWGESSKSKGDQIAKIFQPRRIKMKIEPSVQISDVLAAREDITVLEKTSSAALIKNTKSAVNRVLIGAVPDRGGRPKEQKPPVEMPSWLKRSQGGGGGGRGRGFGGGRGRQSRGGRGSKRRY